MFEPRRTQDILYIFFWVFPRRLIKIVVCRRFGTLYQFHLQRLDVHTSHPAFEDGTDRVFRNVGIQQSDAGEIPKRIHTFRFKTRRKFEIKQDIFSSPHPYRLALEPSQKAVPRVLCLIPWVKAAWAWL